MNNMARNNSIYTSNNSISPFQEFATKLGMELQTRDVSVLKFLITDKVPESVLEDLNAEREYSGLKWLHCLKTHKIICENDVRFLIEALRLANRIDLAEKAQQYQETVGEDIGVIARTKTILVSKPMPSNIFCSTKRDCLPLFFAAELGYAAGCTNICKRMISASKKAFNYSCEERQCYSNSELLVLVKFGNHSNSNPLASRRHESVAVVVENLNSLLECCSFCGEQGGTSGIADALAKFVGYVESKRMPKEIPKLCILICYISSKSSDLEYFRCPGGKDAISLCHTLAEHAIPLYVVGIDLAGVQASARAIPHVKKENCFLSGITLIGGGQYFQVSDISHVQQAIECIIKENASIENNMGTVSDIIIQERNKEDGDLNVEHLAELIQDQLNLRSCTVDNIQVNNQSTEPISQLVQRIAWADNLNDAIEAVKSWKRENSEAPLQRQLVPARYQTRSITSHSSSTSRVCYFASNPSTGGVSHYSSCTETTQNLQFKEQHFSSATRGNFLAPSPTFSMAGQSWEKAGQMVDEPSASNQTTIRRKRKAEHTKTAKTRTKCHSASQSTSNSDSEVTLDEMQRVSLDVARRMVRRQITRQAHYKRIEY